MVCDDLVLRSEHIDRQNALYHGCVLKILADSNLNWYMSLLR